MRTFRIIFVWSAASLSLTRCSMNIHSLLRAILASLLAVVASKSSFCTVLSFYHSSKEKQKFLPKIQIVKMFQKQNNMSEKGCCVSERLAHTHSTAMQGNKKQYEQKKRNMRAKEKTFSPTNKAQKLMKRRRRWWWWCRRKTKWTRLFPNTCNPVLIRSEAEKLTNNLAWDIFLLCHYRHLLLKVTAYDFRIAFSLCLCAFNVSENLRLERVPNWTSQSKPMADTNTHGKRTIFSCR